jgi:hypothetical protein
MHRCKIRLSSIRSTSASIQCRNAKILLDTSIQDNIMSEKKHQCLHSVQECTRYVYCRCMKGWGGGGGAGEGGGL